MSAYQTIAPYYDRLFDPDVHVSWFRFAQPFLNDLPFPVREVLDLACGTGTLSLLLAQAGYDITGVDGCCEMLSVAAGKSKDCPEPRPLFLGQSMPELDLYGTVDAAVCSLDSLNYLTSVAALRRTLERVHLFLRPGGLFLFDVVTPHGFHRLAEHPSVSQGRDVTCVWHSLASEDFCRVTHKITLFVRRPDGLWRRLIETHRQRTMPPHDWARLLRSVGFKRVEPYGDRTRSAPDLEEARVFFVAYK